MKLNTARLFNKRQALSSRWLSCHQNPSCCGKQRWGRKELLICGVHNPQYEIWGFHTSSAEYSSLLGFHAMVSG